MDTESLLEYMENDRNFTRVDPFEEFVPGINDQSLYILLYALEALQKDTMDKTWDGPLLPQVARWFNIVMEEYNSRHITIEGVISEAVFELHGIIDTCPHCYKGMVYGQTPEDGPLHECSVCYQASEALGRYQEYQEYIRTTKKIYGISDTERATWIYGQPESEKAKRND